jgi:hypothetical protein
VEEPETTQARRERIISAISKETASAAQRKRTRRAVRLVFGSAAVAAAIALALGLRVALREYETRSPTAASQSAPDSALVRPVSGLVTLVRNGTPVSVHSERPLETGDRLNAVAEAEAEVRLGDPVLVNLHGPHSLSLLSSRGAERRIRLDNGRIKAQVSEHPSDRPKLIVETPDVEVVVKGTVFEVNVRHDDANASTTGVAVQRGRVLIRRAGRDVTVVSAGETWSSREVVASSRSAGEAPNAQSHRARSRAGTTVERTPPSGTLGEENRLYQSAMEARNRRDDVTAVAFFSALLTRYPHSPLAPEAHVERMRALERIGRKDDAAREADRYLDDHPRGFAHDEARELILRKESAESTPAK